MAKIYSETKPIGALTSSERATMLGLLSLEFLGVNRTDFTRDLGEKDVVMLLRKDGASGEIVGFSTLMTLGLSVPGRDVRAVFSGDTTVLPEYRTSVGFGVELLKYFLHAMRTHTRSEVYYILISKGWRTYKILPFFFKHFAPKHDEGITPRDKEVMDAFGRFKYPQEYSPSSGLIFFTKQTQRLIPNSLDAVPPGQPDAHITFFLQRNPTYLSGTELVCVAPLTEENLTPVCSRLLRSGGTPGREQS